MKGYEAKLKLNFTKKIKLTNLNFWVILVLAPDFFHP